MIKEIKIEQISVVVGGSSVKWLNVARNTLRAVERITLKLVVANIDRDVNLNIVFIHHNNNNDGVIPINNHLRLV